MKISSWKRELTDIAKRSTFLSERPRRVPMIPLTITGTECFLPEGGKVGEQKFLESLPFSTLLSLIKKKEE
jgi:hypothetical protein